MANQWVVVTLGLGAAFAFAVSTSLKHISAGPPQRQSLRPHDLARFAWTTITHALWLSAIAVDVVGLICQLVALHLGALAIVQPVLVSGLIFALVIRQRFAHRRLTRAQLRWATLLTLTLAGFLLITITRTDVNGHSAVDRTPAVMAGIVGAVLAVACVELGRRQRGHGSKAALTGIAVGILFAASAALLKALTDIAVVSPVALMRSWQLYAVIIVGAAGLLLSQLAFQAGPLSASLPATTTVDPLLSVVVGVTVYDEQLDIGPGSGAVLVGLLLLMGVAVIQLSRTPDVAAPPSEIAAESSVVSPTDC
jgi:drug/metabolite transporter (DMT)-like permease